MSITVEMTNSQYEKYVKHVSILIGNEEEFILFPRDIGFLKYWKYRKVFKGIFFDKAAKNFIRFDNENEFQSKIIKEYIKEIYNTYEYLVFEFPDDMEEEVFYFKLKYCN